MNEDFEYDPAKSAANRDKHGIDFVQAQVLWDGTGAVKPVPHVGEKRLMRVGRIGLKVWAAVFTMRDGRVRLISVRRARHEEEVEHGRETGTGRQYDHES